MRAVLISVAILLMCGAVPAQQRNQSAPVQRTFVPDEPLVCIAFDGMAARLDAVYSIEEISKSEYEEGVKRYRDVAQEEGADYFIVGKDKYQRISQRPDKLAEFIRWYAVDGGRGQMETANMECSTELSEKQEKYSGIYTLRRLQDQMTIAQAESLLADVALKGQNVVIKALLESEAARRKDVDRYNKLVESVNAYNKAVSDLVETVNTAMSEPKGSKIAPTLSFNFVRLQPITCTASTFAFTDSMGYMTNVRVMATANPTMHCE
jgi:hypothetical protein